MVRILADPTKTVIIPLKSHNALPNNHFCSMLVLIENGKTRMAIRRSINAKFARKEFVTRMFFINLCRYRTISTKMLPKNVSSIVTTNPNTTSDVSVFVTANVAVFWIGVSVVLAIELFVRFVIMAAVQFFVRKICQIPIEKPFVCASKNATKDILNVHTVKKFFVEKPHLRIFLFLKSV